MGEDDWFPRAESQASRIAYRICRFLVTWAVRLYTRMSIEGRENIPSSGAFILAPVHRSNVDTPIAACVTRRRMRFMGKDTLWRKRWFGWIAYMLGAFPVHRGTADREAFRRGVAILDSGQPLVLFPEGERKSGPIVQPLFDGAVYMALKTGVPIVPVGIGGSEAVMPKGSKLVYPRRVHVIIGEPIAPPAELAAAGGPTRIPRRLIRAETERLHGVLQELFDSAQRAAGVALGSADQPEPD